MLIGQRWSGFLRTGEYTATIRIFRPPTFGPSFRIISRPLFCDIPPISYKHSKLIASKHVAVCYSGGRGAGLSEDTLNDKPDDGDNHDCMEDDHESGTENA